MRSSKKNVSRIYNGAEYTEDFGIDRNYTSDISNESNENQENIRSRGSEKSRASKITDKYRKKRKRKKIIRIIVILLMIIAVVLGFIATRPKYNISQIEVIGNKQMNEREIISDANIKVGDNIFKMNVFMREKKMKKNPFYSSVSIERHFPDKIVIHVKEQKPTIAFPYGEKYVLINSDGIVMKLSDENPKLSEIVGVAIKTMERGKVLKTNDDELFEKSLEFLSLVEENDLFFKRIDLRKKNAKLNVYDNLYVKGKLEAITASIENGNLKKVLIDLYTKGMKRGTVVIDGKDNCSFTPKYN